MLKNAEKYGIAGFILAVGYTIYVHSKIAKTNEIINASVDNVSKDLKVDISELIVNRAVTKAVNREVDKAVREASYEVTASIRKDIHEQVRTSVTESYSSIRNSVTSEVAKQVAVLDMNILKREVKDEAKELVVKKFNENLDSLLQDFNQNLTNVSKIYESIAENMTTKKNSEMVFKIDR